MSDINNRVGSSLLATMINAQRGYMELMQKAVAFTSETMTLQNDIATDHTRIMLNHQQRSLDLIRRSQESFSTVFTPILAPPSSSQSTSPASDKEIMPVGEEDRGYRNQEMQHQERGHNNGQGQHAHA